MGFELNGSRLREARRYRQFTIAELAERVEVSKQMVSRYERGTATPGLEVFSNIVAVLRFPVDFFVDDDKVAMTDEGTFFRSRLTATQAEKKPSEIYKKATAVVRDLFGDYIDFPAQFDNHIENASPKEAARALREQWKLGERPIEDMMYLLESHGILVSIVDSKSHKVDAHSGFFDVGNNRYYLVSVDAKHNSFYRQQRNLAHEMGHRVLHADSFNPATLDAVEYRAMEKEADEFASEFMLPEQEFRTSVGSKKMDLDWYVRLKAKWFVSAASMVYRARQIGILNADEYLRLQKRISYRKWRTEEPLDNEHAAKEPVLLRQSLDLLEDAGKVSAAGLYQMLGEKYGTPFPNEILAQVIGVPMSRFNGEILKLKKSN